MRRRGYLWCSARTERAANCRDVRTCKSAVEKRNCKCMGRTRERKLKFVCKIAKIDRGSLCDFTVAPHAGAWVEMSCFVAANTAPFVAPHAGAWVEITLTPQRRSEILSPPTRGRGLKSLSPSGHGHQSEVAPHAGAWVEIAVFAVAPHTGGVAPHAGAWVEIKMWWSARLR